MCSLLYYEGSNDYVYLSVSLVTFQDLIKELSTHFEIIKEFKRGSDNLNTCTFSFKNSNGRIQEIGYFCSPSDSSFDDMISFYFGI